MKKLSLLLLLITIFSFKLADIQSIYQIPMQANAVCATDLDLDGDLDIVIKHTINAQTGWGGIYELENNGYGNFTNLDSIYDTAGIWTVYADTVLSKTYPDIVYHSSGNVKILSTNENGYEISQYQTGNNINDFSLGDVDGNGELDVVFISSLYQYWGIIFNQGDHIFSAPIYYETYNPPNDILCKDLDGDNKDEVVVGGGSFITEIWTYTDGGFENQKLIYGATNIEIADFDQDGANDIITVSDLMIISVVHLYENKGDNIFDTVNNFKFPEGCSDLLVADFNNDSLPDLLLQTFVYIDSSGYLLYYNQGDFQMGEPDFIELTVYGEERRFSYVADMDGNGFNDIIVTRQVFDTAYAPSLIEILFNDGLGNFGEDPLTNIASDPGELQNLFLTCYPNPAKSKINITLGDLAQGDEIKLYNINGQVVRRLEIVNNKKQYEINIHDLPSGMYVAVLLNKGTALDKQKVIIEN